MRRTNRRRSPRSPLIAAEAENPGPYWLDALAIAPALARATFDCAATPQASISMMRAHESGEAVARTRMRLVVKGAKVMVRFTRLLPVTVPSVTQPAPFQPSTTNPVSPYWLKVIVSVGSLGELNASWIV